MNASRKSGSAELAWWAVLGATIVMGAGLLFFGPHSGIAPDGTPANPFPDIARRLLTGLAMTGKVVGLALVFSCFFGIVIGVGRVSRFAPFNLAASIYVETIRGIPLLVILFGIYYGANQFLSRDYKLDAFPAAILGLTICYSAFMGEAVRAGIESIPPEESEAASLEGSRLQVLAYVTLPRALRTILPAAANEFIALLKDSSLISILAIREVTRAGQEYASAKFLYFETYTMVALCYMFLTLVLSRIVRVLERTWGA